MSSHNPDPEDGDLTGLEPGGGVPPGETPPAEASSPAPEHERDDRQDKNHQGGWLIGTGAVFVAVIAAAIIGRIFGIY
ncbi:DUF6480 family protein [Arthrobacter monumenti]